MVEIVTLNKVRKAKAKAAEKQKAEANRALHGLPKEAKRKALSEASKAARDLDGKKIDR